MSTSKPEEHAPDVDLAAGVDAAPPLDPSRPYQKRRAHV